MKAVFPHRDGETEAQSNKLLAAVKAADSVHPPELQRQSIHGQPWTPLSSGVLPTS